MQTKLSARQEFEAIAAQEGWQTHGGTIGQRKNGQDYRQGLQLFKTVHIVRFTGGERGIDLTVEFTETGGFVTGTLTGPTSVTWKRMTKVEVLGQLLSHGPEAQRRHAAAYKARQEADKAQSIEDTRRRLQAAEMALTGAQAAVYNALRAAGFTEAQATEVVIFAQAPDGPVRDLANGARTVLDLKLALKKAGA